MASFEDILDDEELWQSLRMRLLANNEQLWAIIWETGCKKAFELGQKRVARDLGIQWSPFRGKEYYSLHGRRFIDQLTDSDISQIRDLLERSWGVGEDVFARLADHLASPERLRRIYRTEIHLSNEHAGLLQARDAGVRTRSWLAVGDERMCADCSRLEAENQEVPLDQPYTNGEMAAHAHPQCRCRTVYLP